MSTATFKKAITDLATNKVILTIITLSHADWASDITMVDNTTAITSNGIVYQPYGLVFAPPSDGQSGNPTAKLEVDDMDQILTANFRSIDSFTNATISIILADDPDQVELGPLPYVVKNTSIAGATINLTLQIDSVLRNNLSGFSTDANYFPGLFL